MLENFEQRNAFFRYFHDFCALSLFTLPAPGGALLEVVSGAAVVVGGGATSPHRPVVLWFRRRACLKTWAVLTSGTAFTAALQNPVVLYPCGVLGRHRRAAPPYPPTLAAPPYFATGLRGIRRTLEAKDSSCIN